MWNDETRFAVLTGLGELTAKVARGNTDDRATLAELRSIAKLLGPGAMTKGGGAPVSCPADGLAEEVRAAGFRMSDAQVEDMVRSGTTPTVSGSAEVRRLMATFNRRQIPEWAAKLEDGRETYLRKLVREHAMDPAPPRSSAPRAQEPEQRSLPIDRPVSIQEFLAERPDLKEKAAPLLAGFGGVVKPERPRIAVEPPPLEGDALEAAKRRAKGEGR